MTPEQTLPSLHNAVNAEAFSSSYSLNYAMSELSTASLHNAVDEEALILSDAAFSSAHSSSFSIVC